MKKGFIWLLGIYLCILFGAALIAGFTFDFVHYLAQRTSIEWIQYLARKPLAQYVDRLRLIGFFFIALPFICKKLRISKKSLDIHFNRTAYLITFCRGCLLWCCLFTIIVCITKTLTPIQHTPAIFPIFFASFLIAILEEVIFRGVCFEVIRKKHSINHSITLLSLLFAILHFSTCSNSNINTYTCSSIQALQCAVNSITNIFSSIQWPYFCCLFLLNGILVRFRLIYRSLWAAIGFHQGLVFTLMLIRKHYQINTSTSNFWGSGHLTDAWFVVIILAVINIQMRRYLSSNEKTI